MPRKKREVPWLDTRGGVYHAFWYDSVKRRTERLSLRTTEPGEAAHRFAAFLTQGGDIYSAGSSGPARLTCGAAMDYYVAEHVRVKVVDGQRQEDAVANLKLFFNDIACADLDIPASRDYAAKRMSGELCRKTKHGKVRRASAGTVKRELSVLQAAMAHCVAWKHGLTAADMPKLEKPKTKRSKGLWLFKDELEALRTAADQKTRDFIDLAYYTGARRRSIETLTWFQVDMVRGRINLAKPDDPETKKRKPIVPISPELRPLLERLYSKTVASGLVLGSTASMWSGFKTARKAAGLRWLCAKDMRPRGSLSPHVLRHTRATHLLQQGVHPKAVADLLGDNVMTVLRVYGHACSDYLAEVLGEGAEK